MSVTVKALAEIAGGEVLGDGDVEVVALRAAGEAIPGAICPLLRKRALARAPVIPAAVLTNRALASFALERGVRAALVHGVPQVALAALIDWFHPQGEWESGIHGSAVVEPSARVHPTARVEALAVVERDVVIGAHSVVGPSAVICRECVIGDRVRIGPGAVIGYEGFGFVPLRGEPLKVRQVGRVVVEDDVEIGANTCIDRGTLGTTRIGRGTKIDNLVQIGHNARVGEAVLMAGQTGIAGSCTVEDRALIGGQAGVADHLIIGAGARVAAKSGVTRDVKPGETVAGYPAMPRERWRKAMVKLAQSSIVTTRGVPGARDGSAVLKRDGEER